MPRTFARSLSLTKTVIPSRRIGPSWKLSALELVADPFDHVVEPEMAGFFGHLRMEHDL